GGYTQTGGTTDLQVATLGSETPPPGNALSFDGINDFVSAPSSPSLNPTSQVTVEAWVRVNSLSGIVSGIAGTWDSISGSNRSYGLWINGGKAQFFLSHTGGDFNSVTGTTSLQVGMWYHLAGTFDGTTLKVYVNGALEGTTSSPGVIHTNTRPF